MEPPHGSHAGRRHSAEGNEAAGPVENTLASVPLASHGSTHRSRPEVLAIGIQHKPARPVISSFDGADRRWSTPSGYQEESVQRTPDVRCDCLVRPPAGLLVPCA